MQDDILKIWFLETIYRFFHSGDSNRNYHSFRRNINDKKSGIVNCMSKVVDDISHKEIDAPFRVCFVINKNKKSRDEKDKLGRNKQRSWENLR